jgi:CRP-like cAMP-binding protein
VELRGVPITVLKTGSYFGEIGLLRDARRNATVRAVSNNLDLFVLTKVTNLYPLPSHCDFLRESHENPHLFC